MRTTREIIHDINHFVPDDGNWLRLDTLLDELWTSGDPQTEIENLFKLFERFPKDESAGVLWSALHGLESLDNYEPELLASLNRQPSGMAITMLKRISNTGQKKIAGVDLDIIVKSLMDHPLSTDPIKEDIRYLFL